MKKKILVLFLATVILAMNTLITVSFASDDKTVSNGEISFINMLNISAGLEGKSASDAVSKGEFVSMIVKSLKITEGEIDNSFYDVSEKDKFAKEIYTATTGKFSRLTPMLLSRMGVITEKS